MKIFKLTGIVMPENILAHHAALRHTGRMMDEAATKVL
jgi:hypothetical protein